MSVIAMSKWSRRSRAEHPSVPTVKARLLPNARTIEFATPASLDTRGPGIVESRTALIETVAAWCRANQDALPIALSFEADFESDPGTDRAYLTVDVFDPTKQVP